MNISDKFKGNFTFKYIDGKNWLLTGAVTYVDSVMGDICIPVYVEGDKEYGFVTDGASSPSVSWAIIGCPMSCSPAAVFHDFLYVTQELCRKDSDLVLYRALIDLGVNKAIAEAMYVAVRSFGWIIWNRRKPFIMMPDNVSSDFLEIKDGNCELPDNFKEKLSPTDTAKRIYAMYFTRNKRNLVSIIKTKYNDIMGQK